MKAIPLQPNGPSRLCLSCHDGTGRCWRTAQRLRARGDPELLALGWCAMLLQIAFAGAMVMGVFGPTHPHKGLWLLFALSTALHAVHLSMKALVRPLAECRVLVLGGGAIGMLAALLLRRLGVDRLEVAEVNALRRTSIEQQVRCRAFDPRSAGADDSAFEYVIDAVGGAITRKAALAAVKPGRIVMHIGLQDWASEIDMRKLTLAEITLMGTYTYGSADLRAAVALLARGAFGDLSWVERRPLDQGAQAFDDLHHGRLAAAKVVLEPAQ